MKVILIVLDSVGIGIAPDQAEYDDVGAATLPHIADAVGGLSLPTLQKLGLGNIPAVCPTPLAIRGVDPVGAPLASYGAMQEVSQGKDTITGHWEIGGIDLRPGFALFPHNAPSFPESLTSEFTRRTGRGILGNKAASGLAIIDELGPEHMHTGKWIVYTSADSVFQLCAHEEIIPIAEQYRACEIARELCDPLRVGRVIARPFIGRPGSFTRTENRRDYAYKPSEPTILEHLRSAGKTVLAVGKIEDIFAHRGITESNHTGNNHTSQKQVGDYFARPGDAFIFANFIDFDMLYGHRRDAHGYADCLKQTDEWLAGFLPKLSPGDALILTADHGNDPTFKGNDHTREVVPLLVYRPGQPGKNLGLRHGFYDIAQTVASLFGIAPMPRGISFA